MRRFTEATSLLEADHEDETFLKCRDPYCRECINWQPGHGRNPCTNRKPTSATKTRRHEEHTRMVQVYMKGEALQDFCDENFNITGDLSGEISVADLLQVILLYLPAERSVLFTAGLVCKAWFERVECVPQWRFCPKPLPRELDADKMHAWVKKQRPSALMKFQNIKPVSRTTYLATRIPGRMIRAEFPARMFKMESNYWKMFVAFYTIGTVLAVYMFTCGLYSTPTGGCLLYSTGAWISFAALGVLAVVGFLVWAKCYYVTRDENYKLRHF